MADGRGGGVGIGGRSLQRLPRGSWASPRGIPHGEVSRWGRRGVSGNALRDRPVVPGSEGLRPGATCEVCGYRGHWPRECLSGKPRAAAVQPPASGSTDAATAW